MGRVPLDLCLGEPVAVLISLTNLSGGKGEYNQAISLDLVRSDSFLFFFFCLTLFMGRYGRQKGISPIGGSRRTRPLLVYL